MTTAKSGCFQLMDALKSGGCIKSGCINFENLKWMNKSEQIKRSKRKGSQNSFAKKSAKIQGKNLLKDKKNGCIKK